MQGKSSVSIHASRDAVYGQIAEFSRHPAWKRGLRVEPDAPGRPVSAPPTPRGAATPIAEMCGATPERAMVHRF